MSAGIVRPKLWRIDELMVFLNLETPAYIYKHTYKGARDRIPHLKFGSLLRFDPESPEFKDWVDRHRQEIEAQR